MSDDIFSMLGRSALGNTFKRILRFFRIPSSGPAPYWIITADIPAVLRTFYAAQGTIVSGMIAYTAPNEYHFTVWIQVIASNQMTLSQGWVHNGNLIYESVVQHFDPTSLIPRFIGFGDNFGQQSSGTQIFMQGATASATAHLLNPAAADYSVWNIDNLTDFNIDFNSQGRGFQAQNMRNAGTVATSNAGGVNEVAIPSASWQNEPTVNFRDSRIYRFTLNVWVFIASATETTTQLSVRLGAQTVTGTRLMYWNLEVGTTGNLDALSYTLVSYAYRAAGAGDLASKVSVTNNCIRGAASSTLTSFTGPPISPITLTIEDIGSVYTPAAPGLPPMPIAGMNAIA